MLLQLHIQPKQIKAVHVITILLALLVHCELSNARIPELEALKTKLFSQHDTNGGVIIVGCYTVKSQWSEFVEKGWHKSTPAYMFFPFETFCIQIHGLNVKIVVFVLTY